ncbi:MAG: hypothetical protein HKM89_07940, partial [Gemmatimonadales bacterium]|nr:hypothetical protein [Gemmatimonadales bacterium]
MPTGITTERLIIRDRIILLSSAVVILALAWLLLAGSGSGFGGVDVVLVPHAHATARGGLPAVFSLWLVMMVAMMLPPVLPWVLFFGAVARDHHPSAPSFPSAAILAGGYFTIWAGFSAVAALGQLGL